MTEHVTKGRYLQLWAPFIARSWSDSAWNRDINRAQRAWAGEMRMWLIPGLQGEPRRWAERMGNLKFREAAVPSETFNVIDIIHVSPGGWAFPFSRAWGPQLRDDLLPLWLNAKPLTSFSSPPAVTIKVPVFGDAEEGTPVEYIEQTLDFEPGPVLPFAWADSNAQTAYAVWPPPGIGLPTPPISPETENRELPNLPSDRSSLPVYVFWDGPFGALFPMGATTDLLFEHAEMRRAHALHSEGRRREALGLVEARLSILLHDGVESTRELAWFLPSLMESRSQALADLQLGFGLRFPDRDLEELSDALAHPRFREVMDAKVQVTRVFGWEGLLWLSLRQCFDAYTHTGLCPFCGASLVGGRIGRGCRRDENPKCVKDRAATRRRKSRHSKAPSK